MSLNATNTSKLYAKTLHLNEEQLLSFEYPLLFLELVNYLCGVQIFYRNEEESALGLNNSRASLFSETREDDSINEEEHQNESKLRRKKN